jgi:hypothetical protein
MLTSAPIQPIEVLDLAEIPIERKSGFVVYFTLAGRTYTVTAGCECPAAAFALYDLARTDDRTHEHSVKPVCEKHGARPTIAYAERPRQHTAAERQVFGWALDRHAADKRVSWGMSRRSA